MAVPQLAGTSRGVTTAVEIEPVNSPCWQADCGVFRQPRNPPER